MTEQIPPTDPLRELKPLAAVIEEAIQSAPIRLGTDDWGTVLAANILANVAAYMGRTLGPDPALLAQAQAEFGRQSKPSGDDEQTLRWARRESLLVLLTRLERGRPLTADEARTLRHHVETELREADTARAVARSNLHHVKTIVPELEQAQAAIERVRTLRAPFVMWRDITAALDGTEQPTTTEA